MINIYLVIVLSSIGTNYVHSATLQNLLLHNWSPFPSEGDPSHFNLDPVPRVTGIICNFLRERLGSVVISYYHWSC